MTQMISIEHGKELWIDIQFCYQCRFWDESCPAAHNDHECWCHPLADYTPANGYCFRGKERVNGD